MTLAFRRFTASDSLLGGHRRNVEPGDIPGAHRGVPADLRRVEYGDERDPKMREFLEKIAPMNKHREDQEADVRYCGENDPRVPVSESQQIADALKKQGTRVWLLIAKDEGHGYREGEPDFQFYATVEFLREYLLK